MNRLDFAFCQSARFASIHVDQYIITQHGWEYYLEKPEDQESRNYRFGLVMGVATEMGMVDVNEVLPYATLVAVGDELNELMPAEGWEWSE
tara:strand:+ start:179 stop:451 length:273 start_codon:yes stop_codon:yes gene_type:complete